MRRYPAPAGRTLTARALRKGDRWTVVMRDMDDAVAEKRDSRIEMIFGKLLPAGFRRESFAGRQNFNSNGILNADTA